MFKCVFAVVYSELCHQWHSTSQSCWQVIGFTQKLGQERTCHAESKIDLGLYSERKMKGFQIHHTLSHVSLQLQYFPCVISVCAWAFYTCDVNTDPGPESREVWGSIQESCQHFMSLDFLLRLFNAWRTAVRNNGQKANDTNQKWIYGLLFVWCSMCDCGNSKPSDQNVHKTCPPKS